MPTDPGTRERKRAAKAIPPRIAKASPGCIGAVIAYLALCAFLHWAGQSTWSWALVTPAVVLLVIAVASEVRGVVLLAKSQRQFVSRGILCLVVHSESSAWADRIHTSWLPRLGARATALNWSERSAWPDTLEVKLFRHFVEASGHNFNPAVLVFRGLRRPHVFRFYYAFQQATHGRTHYLETLETEMFSVLQA